MGGMQLTFVHRVEQATTERNQRDAGKDQRTQCPADYDCKGKFDKMKNIHYIIFGNYIPLYTFP